MLRHEVRTSHGWSNLKPKKQKPESTSPSQRSPPFRSLPRSKYSSSLCVCTSWEASQFHWTATTVDENLRKLDTTGGILCICTFFNEPPFWCFEEKSLVILEKTGFSQLFTTSSSKNSIKCSFGSGWKILGYHFGTSLKSGPFLVSSIMPTSTLKGDACTPLGFHTAPLVYKLAFAAPSKEEQQYLSKSSRWWGPLKNHSSLVGDIVHVAHEMIWTRISAVYFDVCSFVSSTNSSIIWDRSTIPHKIPSWPPRNPGRFEGSPSTTAYTDHRKLLYKYSPQKTSNSPHLILIQWGNARIDAFQKPCRNASQTYWPHAPTK